MDMNDYALSMKNLHHEPDDHILKLDKEMCDLADFRFDHDVHIIIRIPLPRLKIIFTFQSL